MILICRKLSPNPFQAQGNKMLIKKKKKEEKEFSSIFLIHLKNCTSTQKKKTHGTLQEFKCVAKPVVLILSVISVEDRSLWFFVSIINILVFVLAAIWKKWRKSPAVEEEKLSSCIVTLLIFSKKIPVCVWNQKSTARKKKQRNYLLIFVQQHIWKYSEAIYFKWHPESGSKSAES